MTEDNNGASDDASSAPPDYDDMAARLYDIGTQLVAEGKAKNSDDLIEKGERLIRIASQIRSRRTS